MILTKWLSWKVTKNIHVQMAQWNQWGIRCMQEVELMSRHTVLKLFWQFFNKFRFIKKQNIICKEMVLNVFRLMNFSVITFKQLFLRKEIFVNAQSQFLSSSRRCCFSQWQRVVWQPESFHIRIGLLFHVLPCQIYTEEKSCHYRKKMGVFYIHCNH